MVKEHKQMVHGKKNASLSVKAIKDAALCSKESEDEVRRWREERKRNYPTTSNIKRKVAVSSFVANSFVVVTFVELSRQ
jgi:hypothetical protein